MNNFIKKKATNLSISQRKKMAGGAVNDAWYVTNPNTNGVRAMCPAYCRWINMLKRAYSKKYQLLHPSYIGVTVCDEWLKFSNFADWFYANYKHGHDLDKDLKIKGNKLYSPETCLFVDNSINKLIVSCHSESNLYPEGVGLEVKTGKYRARISIDGERVHLGTFNSMHLASEAYIVAKNNEIKRKASLNPSISDYLLAHLL